MVGLAGTNALPTMAPRGGTDKIVGINPLSISFPTAEKPPFVLDIAFGATAHGKIRVYHQKGAPIPEGWAFDAAGTGGSTHLGPIATNFWLSFGTELGPRIGVQKGPPACMRRLRSSTRPPRERSGGEAAGVPAL